MANERRGERRQPSRPGGGGFGEFRPYRNRPPRGGPPEEGAGRDFVPRQGGRGGYGRGQRSGFAPRPAGDEGGMSIRVDPRRLSLLKELAAQEGLRPGQLVQRWIEERLDAERTGGSAPGSGSNRMAELEAQLTSLSERMDGMLNRLHGIEDQFAGSQPQLSDLTTPAAASEPAPTKRRRGRPPKVRTGDGDAAPQPATTRATRARARRGSAAASGLKIALHDEIIDLIRERGPMSASELAGVIRERGRYQAPRSDRPLDAATVNSRVSNPVYRSRFSRSGGKIGLSE